MPLLIIMPAADAPDDAGLARDFAGQKQAGRDARQLGRAMRDMPELQERIGRLKGEASKQAGAIKRQQRRSRMGRSI